MDLSLVSIDDLVDEFFKRTDACIIAYVQQLDNKSEKAIFNFHGGKFTSIGLAENMKRRILDDCGYEEDGQDGQVN